jgi:ribosome modulation factor
MFTHAAGLQASAGRSKNTCKYTRNTTKTQRFSEATRVAIFMILSE